MRAFSVLLFFFWPIIIFFNLTLLRLGLLRSHARNVLSPGNGDRPARPALGMALIVGYVKFLMTAVR